MRKKLGGGGFGTVWRCQDGGLKRDVAIKGLARHDQESPDRFRREAVILARLSHPAIVTVHDIGAHDGHPFIVMELLDGTDLGKFISWHRRGMEIHEILTWRYWLLRRSPARIRVACCTATSSPGT